MSLFAIRRHRSELRRHFTTEFVQVKLRKTSDALAAYASNYQPIGIDLCAHTNRPEGQWTSRYAGLSIKPWFELQYLQ
jgi:hypothetical protein